MCDLSIYLSTHVLFFLFSHTITNDRPHLMTPPPLVVTPSLSSSSSSSSQQQHCTLEDYLVELETLSSLSTLNSKREARRDRDRENVIPFGPPLPHLTTSPPATTTTDSSQLDSVQQSFCFYLSSPLIPHLSSLLDYVFLSFTVLSLLFSENIGNVVCCSSRDIARDKT
jgi:hypothetical protein